MGAPTLKGTGAKIRFCQKNFPKNCMKLKEFGPGVASLASPLDPPLAWLCVKFLCNIDVVILCSNVRDLFRNVLTDVQD